MHRLNWNSSREMLNLKPILLSRKLSLSRLKQMLYVMNRNKKLKVFVQ
jgi:hypothetical protein